MKTFRLELQFSGGAETLLNGEKNHKVEITLPEGEEEFTTADLLGWIRSNLLAECEKPELLITNGNVRPGILVLLNDTDWEIMDGVSALLNGYDLHDRLEETWYFSSKLS